MKKLLFVSLFLSFSLFARESLHPVESCAAYNNMKHTKNSHNVILDKEKAYTILDRHKGQMLILVKGEKPAQRWVDAKCFTSVETAENSLDNYIKTLDNKQKISKHTKKYEQPSVSKQNLLALSWHNAFCETHRSKKECRRNMFMLFKSKYKESHFILHGLWPQPKNRVYCNVDRKYITMDKYRHWNKLPSLGLSSETKRRLTEIMPGVHSNLHKHEWIKHGSCYGKDAEAYFKDIISLVEQFHQAEVSTFIEKNIGKRITLKQVQMHFDKSFGDGAGKRVELRCKDGLITELWLHLGSKSEDLATLLQRGTPARSRCKQGFLDKAGFSVQGSYRSGFGR